MHYDNLVLKVFADPTAMLNAVKGNQLNGAKLINNDTLDQVKGAGYTLHPFELDWTGLLLLDRDGKMNPRSRTSAFARPSTTPSRPRPMMAEAGGLNEMMADMGDAMNQLGVGENVTRRTAESSSVLDVLGLNYAEGRYALDRELFPHRVVVGSEAFPSRIGTLWPMVLENPNVIGDFHLDRLGLPR